MRLLPYVFGFSILAAPLMANAAIVFDSVNISPAAFNSGSENSNTSWDWVDPTANGPTASQFSVPFVQTLDYVSLELSADAPSDGGSVMVYLLPDNGSGFPNYTTSTDIYGNTISTFVGGTLIGVIPDSTLSQQSALVTVDTDVVLAAGSYWIGLATSLLPGLSDPPPQIVYGSGQWWWSNPDASDPVTQNFNAIGSPGPFAVGGDPLLTNNPGDYELVVSTPEPATVALLGGAMAGLGLLRKRRNMKRN
jgi:hypothetical protein